MPKLAAECVYPLQGDSKSAIEQTYEALHSPRTKEFSVSPSQMRTRTPSLEPVRRYFSISGGFDGVTGGTPCAEQVSSKTCHR